MDKAWKQVESTLEELQKVCFATAMTTVRAEIAFFVQSGDASVAAAAGRFEVAEVALKGAAKKYQKADDKSRESARAGYAAAQEDSQAKLNALAAL